MAFKRSAVRSRSSPPYKKMNLKEICLPISRELEELEKTLASHLISKFPFIDGVVNYVIHNGGKRLRPLLTILSSKMGGYQGAHSISIGAAIEFMHTASLLHDDVVDNANLRRGRPTINIKWGNQVCVLVGDFFYCRAMDILVKQGDMKILRVVTDAITTTTEGEIFEIIKSNDPATTEDDYLKIISYKTAALIGSACQAGAILGSISEDFELALKDYGQYLGMAFQLMDDVLDYTSTEEEFGKANGTDLREGKLTLPLIVALKKSTENEATFIKNALMGDVLEKTAFNQVFELISKYDGINETTKLAQSYVQKAKDKLTKFKPSIERDALLNIADYVVLRRN
ncbi:MAG: hypothetical protein ACD_73C00812G0007 [uncultured bacterium]|nr:MAG: hypothetical protein ACD_73C00812G0007 [uncultured bacterium]